MTTNKEQVISTLDQMIEVIKAENPVLRIGNDDDGYTELSKDDYDATILDWAQARFTAIQAAAKVEADKSALLAKLGITEDEAKLLLS